MYKARRNHPEVKAPTAPKPKAAPKSKAPVSAIKPQEPVPAPKPQEPVSKAPKLRLAINRANKDGICCGCGKDLKPNEDYLTIVAQVTKEGMQAAALREPVPDKGDGPNVAFKFHPVCYDGPGSF